MMKMHICPLFSKFLIMEKLELKQRAKGGHTDKTKASEDVKTIFKFVFVKIIILSKEVMHVEQVRISHIFNQPYSYAFRGILVPKIFTWISFLSEYLQSTATVAIIYL